MYQRLDRHRGAGYTEEAVAWLTENRRRFNGLFEAPDGVRLGLLRFAKGNAPRARSLRRPLSDVFDWRD